MPGSAHHLIDVVLQMAQVVDDHEFQQAGGVVPDLAHGLEALFFNARDDSGRRGVAIAPGLQQVDSRQFRITV